MKTRFTLSALILWVSTLGPAQAGFAQEDPKYFGNACGLLIETARIEYREREEETLRPGSQFSRIALALRRLAADLSRSERELIREGARDPLLAGARLRLLHRKLRRLDYVTEYSVPSSDFVDGRETMREALSTGLVTTETGEALRFRWKRLRPSHWKEDWDFTLQLDGDLSPEGIERILRYELARQVTDSRFLFKSPILSGPALNADHYARHFAGIPESCFDPRIGAPLASRAEGESSPVSDPAIAGTDNAAGSSKVAPAI